MDEESGSVRLSSIFHLLTSSLNYPRRFWNVWQAKYQAVVCLHAYFKLRNSLRFAFNLVCFLKISQLCGIEFVPTEHLLTKNLMPYFWQHQLHCILNMENIALESQGLGVVDYGKIIILNMMEVEWQRVTGQMWIERLFICYSVF